MRDSGPGTVPGMARTAHGFLAKPGPVRYTVDESPGPDRREDRGDRTRSRRTPDERLEMRRMKLYIDPDRVLFKRDPMLYGQFLEHFDRQIYGGVYMPGHPLSDEDGFRADVLEALRDIRTPVIRWPGGCFVSAYHWKDGVGKDRTPSFDKAWRVEESNAFGTDEFIRLCRKLGCEPYICTNAGTGGQEEMSDWVEYCNLPGEGRYARMRIANGHEAPYAVRYWSIGNENYLPGEMGSRTHDEWGGLVREAAKMMRRVDPGIELSAAAVADVDWNTRLLHQAGPYLKWISIHGYWDGLWQKNDPATYEQCMAATAGLDRDVQRVRGLLTAFGLEKKIRIAYDEWNLRGWHHPDVDTAPLGDRGFIEARAKADINATYTMADAVFTGCFLNMLLRNADIVGMANYAPAVNTRGLIHVHDGGIVRRTTYHVFRMYTHLMGDQVIDSWMPENVTKVIAAKDGAQKAVDMVDVLATRCGAGDVAVSLINKDAETEQTVEIRLPGGYSAPEMTGLRGDSADAFNDAGNERVRPEDLSRAVSTAGGTVRVTLSPHSVNILKLRKN